MAKERGHGFSATHALSLAYPHHDGYAFVVPQDLRDSCPDNIAPSVVNEPPNQQTKNFKLVSYNAGSLCDTVRVEKKPDFVDRPHLLAKLFVDFHIIGIQEARTPPGSKMPGDFFRIS